MQSKIVVRGAREHNLRNVDVEIPRDSLVVVTGLSGSGKSTLAFDTIYAEGQRRYGKLVGLCPPVSRIDGKPDVDSIEGLSPAISIEQKTTSRNPRSTSARSRKSMTICGCCSPGRHPLLLRRPACPSRAKPFLRMVDRIEEMVEGTRLFLLALIVRGRKGEYRKSSQSCRRKALPASGSTARCTISRMR